MTMTSSSLSSVVSNLVRASMGSTVPNTVTDDELDKHVAELILKEAKQKAERYLQDGVCAYLPDTGPDSNLPRANKRFLSAIIRNTDDHNKAILRAQAEAAQEVRAEKEEQERRERRARAHEATDAERLRRLMGSSSHRRDDDTWERRGDSKRRSHDKHDEASERRERQSHDRRKRRRQSRSRSKERKDGDSERQRRRQRHHDVDSDGEETPSKPRRRHSRSKSADRRRERSSRNHDHSRRPKPHDEEYQRTRHSRDKGKGTDRPQTSPPSPLRDDSLQHTRTRSLAGVTPELSEAETLGDTSAKLSVPASSKKHSPAPGPSDLSSQFRSRKIALASPAPPASPTLSEEEDIERLRPRRRRRASPAPSPGPKASVSASRRASRSPSPDNAPSKMDKYFEDSYDPRLDTGPLTIPTIPATGLIDGAEFESWDAMLDIIRQRREDKAERKRMERLGILPEKEKEKKSVKETEAWKMDAGTGIMDIKYSKRGAVREWDMGKEGF